MRSSSDGSGTIVPPPVVHPHSLEAPRGIERNDPALAALLAAPDEVSQRREIESLLLQVRPVVTTIVTRFARREIRPRIEDREDVESAVALRLIHKLQSLAAGEGEPIEHLDDYVAVLAQNAVTDVLRQRYPEVRRLRRRIRSLLTRDKHFAVWMAGGAAVCGRRAWQGRNAVALEIAARDASREMCDGRRPAEALAAIFARAGGPVWFDDLTRLAATLWGIAEVVCVDAAELEPGDEQPSPLVEYESRRFLQALWMEVQKLRPPHRAALLLNLRDIDGSNALALLMILEIATFDQIAAALEITPERMAELWSDLPLEDQTIAAMFGLSRQQVINLRRTARERLNRRLR